MQSTRSNSTRLPHEELLEGDKDFKIKIAVDKDKGTLTVSDNGVGMNRESAVENLGTIAKSGTRTFLDSLKQANAPERPDLIGQFGVGFYAAFMVADKVTVISHMVGDPKDGVQWESDGQGEFTIEPVEKPKRGTDVILHLKESEKEYLDPYVVRRIVRKFSDFIEHPVVMDVEHEDENKNKTIVEETLNLRKAIWLRNKSEVTPEEYSEFYKQIATDDKEPAASFITQPRETTSFASCCLFRRTGRSSSTLVNRRRVYGSIFSASSSWSVVRNCCRCICGSSRAWSIPPTCR